MTAQVVERTVSHELPKQGVLAEPSEIFSFISEERAADITSIIGCEIQEVEKLPFDLSALNNDGVFINMYPL